MIMITESYLPRKKKKRSLHMVQFKCLSLGQLGAVVVFHISLVYWHVNSRYYYLLVYELPS